MDIQKWVSAFCSITEQNKQGAEKMAEINIEVSSRFASFLTDWDYEQYLLFGGYGSGKSYHVALKIILKLLEEKRTALVVRAVYDTFKDSCFSLFKEILDKMGILSEVTTNRVTFDNKVIAVRSPMEIRFPNGSKIIFKGMDNPEKFKSINGVSIVWVEECSEIRYDGYTELLGRIREPNISFLKSLSKSKTFLVVSSKYIITFLLNM